MAYELQTLDRGLQCLNALEERSPRRLTDLSRALETNQTTMLRTLRVLERHGYVRRVNDHDYYLGTKVIELGQAAVSRVDLITAISPWTNDLSSRLDATVHVGIMQSGAVTVIAKVEPISARVKYSAVGTRMPLHATAAGKAALALASQSRAPFPTPPEPYFRYTPSTISDPIALTDSIAETICHGFSTEIEEYNTGFACVGTALRFDGDIYAVSISGPLVSERELQMRGRMLEVAISSFSREHGGVDLRLQHRVEAP